MCLIINMTIGLLFDLSVIINMTIGLLFDMMKNYGGERKLYQLICADILQLETDNLSKLVRSQLLGVVFALQPENTEL